MNKENNIKQISIIVISFLLGGVFMILLMKFTNYPQNTQTIITKNGTKIYEKSSLATSIEKIYDAVLVIEAYNNDTLLSTGTGFIYKVDDKYGYILTNEHVVNEGNTIKGIMTNDEEMELTILGKDEYIDLAVLRIDKKYVSLVATLGKSEEMNLGDTIFTVGSPLGNNYRGTVTSGILSGKDRMVTTTVSSNNSNSMEWIMKVLQIDASINPGNSGGPLLNINGEVIGICSMKFIRDNIEGMGFAIPIEYAISHLDNLEHGKKINWPVLGVEMANISDKALQTKYDVKVDNDIKEGVVVLSVKDNTSAKNAKLQKGDIIISINNKSTKNITYLRYELYQYQADDTVEVTYLRNNKKHTVKVKLGSRE